MLGAGCDRAVAPASAPTPAPVPTLSLAEVLDGAAFVSDAALRRDAMAACARGPIMDQAGRSDRGLRIAAVRLPDGSLLRLRGIVGPGVERGPVYFEAARDWPGGRGVRVATYDPARYDVWVLRYAPGARGRITIDRLERDPAAATTLGALRQRLAELECPQALNRRVDHGSLVPQWTSDRRNGFEWRTEWPPRPAMAGSRAGITPSG